MLAEYYETQQVSDLQRLDQAKRHGGPEATGASPRLEVKAVVGHGDSPAIRRTSDELPGSKGSMRGGCLITLHGPSDLQTLAVPFKLPRLHRMYVDYKDYANIALVTDAERPI